MLPRVLEPEVMDSADEARDYDAMDHGEVNRIFVRDFLHLYDGDGPVLDVGTGSAQIPIELCRCQSRVRVVAVDLAEHMLALGRRNVAAAGLAERLRLERIDAKRLPYPDRSFQAVMSNSIVHHIPAPEIVLAEIARVVSHGGAIFVRDLLRPDSLDALQRLVDLYAADASAHQRQMFADSLHAALTLDEVRAMVRRRDLDPLDVRQTSDRHWTWATRCKLGATVL